MTLLAHIEEAHQLPGLYAGELGEGMFNKAAEFLKKAMRRGDKKAAQYWGKIVKGAKTAGTVARAATIATAQTVGHGAAKVGAAVAKGAAALAKGDVHGHGDDHGDAAHSGEKPGLWDRLKGVGKSLKDAPKNVKRMLTDKDYRAEVGKKVGASLKRKASAAWGMVKHEAHEFKVAGKAIAKIARKEKLDDNDKKALKAAGKALAVTVIGTAAMGGLGHLTVGAMAKHFAAETAVKAVGRAALFASANLNEEDDAIMARWAEAVINGVAEEFEKLGDMDPEDVAKLIADVEYSGGSEDEEDDEETSEMNTGYYARVANRLAEAIDSGTVATFLMVLKSKLTQYDKRLGDSEAKKGRVNIYRLGHYLQAANDVEAAVKGLEQKDDAEALGALKKAMAKSFAADMPPVKATIKQIDAWLSGGKKPSLK